MNDSFVYYIKAVIAIDSHHSLLVRQNTGGGRPRISECGRPYIMLAQLVFGRTIIAVLTYLLTSLDIIVDDEM